MAVARAPSPPGGSFRKQPKDASVCLAPAGSISLGATLKVSIRGRSSPSPRRPPIGRGMYPLWNVDARRVLSLV